MNQETSDQYEWRLAGTYYEACNCEAICPCRKTDGMSQGKATYDTCEFLLSWAIETGWRQTTKLDGLSVAMAGMWHDGTGQAPWDIILYIDDKADEKQREALTGIFLGKAGGNIIFARGVAKVRAVKSARIELDHTKNRERIKVGETIEAKVDRLVEHEKTVTCGVPGHDRPGQESVSSLKVSDGPFEYQFNERCGFSSGFAYWREL